MVALAACSAEEDVAPSVTASEPIAFVQLFEWKWTDIARECEEFLGDAGYTAVQVSPPNEHIEGPAWWTRYQPVSYKIESRGGTREEFADMVARCNASGVDVYSDAVVNHMAGFPQGIGVAGSEFAEFSYAVPYDYDDFHHCGRNDGDRIVDYQDLWEIQTCQLGTLDDLDTGKAEVQAKIAAYLNDLLSLGVDGFRMDAVKHIHHDELHEILQLVNGDPFVYQEVIDRGGEAISAADYLRDGHVTEFKYAALILDAFERGNLDALTEFWTQPGWLPADKAIVFVDNHDIQRGHAFGDEVVNYKDGQRYELAVAFMLAHPYGYPLVMSSYDFETDQDGPPESSPHDDDGCGDAWICEHRRDGRTAMLKFRRATAGEELTNWQIIGGQVLSFGRGNQGHILINTHDEAIDISVTSDLAEGRYIDLIGGDPIDVGEQGHINLSLEPLSIIAILAEPVLAGPIDGLEPPFWWTGFENNELQIMVYGHDVASFEVGVDYRGVTVDRIENVDNSNYLFLYLNIDESVAPGKFGIQLTRGDLSFVHDYQLRARSQDPDYTRGFDTSDTIYLITPDRFVNGDPSNDNINGMGDPVNRNDDSGRHGGDVAGIAQSLEYLSDMGFTAVWINPILENRMPAVSYHGYSTTDFYAVDARFGSNEEYRDLVVSAKQKGLGTIMDMITNHIGSGHRWKNDPPADDWFNFQDNYHQTNNAKAATVDPYASEYDKKVYFDGWYVETMPDLNQRQPLLTDYLVQNAIWWAEYLGLAGIRLDTWSYSDPDFLAEWTRRIMREFPDFNIVAEETGENAAWLSYWQRGKVNHDGYQTELPSMLDFPIWKAMNETMTREFPWWQSRWSPLYDTLATDFVYADASKLVIFPDNHDQSRIFTKVREDYALFRIAIAYYLTMRGTPQIYYGTEVLMKHAKDDGNHGELRGEFPGGWPDHDKNAFTGEGLSAEERDAQEFMQRLLNWRKNSPVIHNGRLMQFVPDKGMYAYFRYDDDDTVMIVFNIADEEYELDMNRFAERTGGYTSGTDVISGHAFGIESTLRLEPKSVLILELQ